MTIAPIPDGTIRRILEDERSTIRFEDFCCDLLTEIEGMDYVGTSRSWDLGRDGRTLPNNAWGGCGYACCTTGLELEAKAEADLNRMLQNAIPAAVHFCTSQFASEQVLQSIEDQIRTRVRAVKTVAALGGYQLVPLIQRHAEPFRRRYAAELLEHADFLAQTSNAAQSEGILGMQIALATQFDDNALVLRSQLIRRLVLKSLDSGAALTPNSIAKSISDSLRLPRVIHSEYFRGTLDELVQEGRVNKGDGQFQITDSGRAAVRSDLVTAKKGFERGKVAVRTAIEELLGTEVDDESFEELWAQLLDEFASLFFAQGLKVIQAISSLTRDAAHSAPTRTFREMLNAMRSRITRLGVGGGRCDAVAQAVVDLFSDGNSEALSWITDVAVKYVSLCSLGLEPTAQQEVSGRLKDLDLILDTDIVLSYLSEGERPHKAIEETVNRWRDVGGTLVILPPVLEEAAYHAWISDREYREMWQQMNSLSAQDLYRDTRNAFVRGFYYAAEGQYEPRRWNLFIGEYRGRHASDTSKIHDILEERGFLVLSEIANDLSFETVVKDRIYELRGIDRTRFINKSTADKAARDGRMVAYLKLARFQCKDRNHTTVIVSSSPILQKAAMSFANELGKPSPVWPIGALAYLVSLVPGARLTLSVLRNCLFDEGELDLMDQITQFAMRVIRNSKEYSIGYSQRPTLKRALQQQIDKAALQRGQRASALVEELVGGAPEIRATLTEIIAEAVDTFQASRSEKEIMELRRKVDKGHGRSV